MAVHRVSGQIPCISTMYLTMVFDRIAKRRGKGANISNPPQKSVGGILRLTFISLHAL